MIFKFGKKPEQPAEREYRDEEEYELVKFKGATNGNDPNLHRAQRLVDAGLEPAKELVTDALLRRSELIRIDPKGAQSQVTLFIDGMPYSGGRLGKQESMAIVQMLKLLAGLDIKIRNQRQKSGLRAALEDDSYELELTVAPTDAGERLIIRVKDLSLELNTVEDLGGNVDHKQKLRDLLSDNGFLAIVGPPNSGVTTAAHAVMRGLDPYLNQMFSLGDIGDKELDNITPFEPEPGEELDESLRRLVRQEADIIFHSGIKDAETASTLLKWAKEVSIVTEYAAQNAAAGLVQLIEWSQKPELVAETVRGVIGIKLIRRLCPACKQVFKPNPSFLAKAGLPDDLGQLSRAAPRGEDIELCDECDGFGFRGRAAAFEVVEMNDAMKQLVQNKPSADEIQRLARKEGMLTLQKDALRLVAEGVTSLDELQRAFRSKK